MTLFTVGPVQMFPETLSVAGKQLPYFRTDEFSRMNLESQRLIKELTGAEECDEAVFLTASGTGGMESAVINCLTETDKVLIISGGSFGHRFCEICGIHNIRYDSIDLEFGQTLDEDTLYKYDGRGYTALLVNIHETSTGQLYDVHMLSEFCKKNRMYFIVDAISSFLADDLDFTRDCMDVMILSSQKALALSPGLSVLILSRRIADERVLKSETACMYLDLKRAICDGERGQTPFTPAVGTLLELNDMLRRLSSIGIETKISRTKNNAEYFRNRISELNLSLPDFPLSNAVTPIMFKNGDAYDIHLKLMTEKNIVLTPSGGDLRNRVLRVSHIGNLGTEDYDELIDCLKEVIQ